MTKHKRYIENFLPVNILLVATLLFSLSVAAADLSEASRLIDAGRHGDAYDLLIRDLEASAGTPDYDLLLGIAALESGHPTQAVFAFERVLDVDPDNVRARLELARAYYDMNENEAAREEFRVTRTKQLPAGVEQTIEQYLTAIDSRLRAEEKIFRFFVEAQAGYDTNVNSATDTSQVALPAFGNLVFTLDQSARELDSGFGRIRGGAAFSTKFMDRDDLRVFGGAEAYYRAAFSESDFSTAAGDAHLGLRYMVDDANALNVSVQGQNYQVGGDTNRNQGGVNLQWLHATPSNTQYSVFGQMVAQRFPGQSVRNVNQYSGGVGVVHIYNRPGDPLVYASVFAGTDEELNDLREDIGRTFVGVRAGGKYSLREDLDLIGGVNYQYSGYNANDPLFQETRKDHFFFLRAGLDYQVREQLKITPEVQYIHNDSTLPINDFDRWQLFVSARYDF
jgi:tetratricopeptide (TPR) repeat protein